MIPLWGSERHIRIYVHYYVRISDVDAPLGLYRINMHTRHTSPTKGLCNLLLKKLRLHDHVKRSKKKITLS